MLAVGYCGYYFVVCVFVCFGFEMRLCCFSFLEGCCLYARFGFGILTDFVFIVLVACGFEVGLACFYLLFCLFISVVLPAVGFLTIDLQFCLRLFCVAVTG